MYQYLAYTAKIGDLGERFDWKSVLQFDREYRVAQANHGFPWASDASHLSTVMLREKGTVEDKLKNAGNRNGAGTYGKPGSARSNNPRFNGYSSMREPCRLFNRGKCDYRICRYEHVFAVPGCGQAHAEVDHKSPPALPST